MAIIVNRKNDRITGAIEGKPFSIMFDQGIFEDLKADAARLEKTKEKAVYESIVEHAQELVVVDFNTEVAAANGYLKYRPNTKTYHLVINKGTKNELVSEDAIPEVLAQRIVESYEEGADFMPLLMAWRRFLTRENSKPEDKNYFASYLCAMFVDEANVSKLREEKGLSAEAAVELSTYNDLSVTTYGLLATFKVVEEVKKIWKFTTDKDGNETKVQVDAFPGTKDIDPITGKVTETPGKPTYLEEVLFTPAIWKNGDQFFCGDKLGYQYQIGKEAILPETAQRNRQNTFGGGGLYCGGLNYIKGYSNNHTETLTCFIDPAEIISFQDAGNAMRVNRMFINGSSSMEGETKGMYFVSDYAKESNLRMAEKFKAAVEKTQAAAKKKAQDDATDASIVGEITK